MDALVYVVDDDHAMVDASLTRGGFTGPAA